MHFALLNGVRVEPEKGLDGAVCPICKQPVRARCGEVRVKHWAHKSVIDCDSWKEPETTWHREWKNLFGDLQEQMHEKDGTRHMADVKTQDGTIVEFRHGPIDLNGKRTREAFFGEPMFWVVDCAAEQKKNRFNFNFGNAVKASVPCDDREIFMVDHPACVFPRSWIECKRFVFFDFGESQLWCLFPRNDKYRHGVFTCISKDDFVAAVKDGFAKFRERCVGIWRQVNEVRRHAPTLRRACFQPGAVQQVETRTDPAGADVAWPADFDRTVSLALTVDAVHAWLIARGLLKEVLTGSQINGEADGTGCCAIHCSASFGQSQLYWAKNKLKGNYGDGIIANVPGLNELQATAGYFIGVAEYCVEELPGTQVKIHLRNFKGLVGGLKSQQSSECFWRLDDALRSQFELMQQRER